MVRLVGSLGAARRGRSYRRSRAIRFDDELVRFAVSRDLSSGHCGSVLARCWLPISPGHGRSGRNASAVLTPAGPPRCGRLP
jgi:hypothetical protein